MRQHTPLSPVMDKSMGAKLKSTMLEKRVTVRALAAATGLSERTIKNLRAGKSGNLSTWRAIAKALRCEIDDITG